MYLGAFLSRRFGRPKLTSEHQQQPAEYSTKKVFISKKSKGIYKCFTLFDEPGLHLDGSRNARRSLRTTFASLNKCLRYKTGLG